MMVCSVRLRRRRQKIPSEEILQQGVAKINWRSITFLINQTDNTEEFLWIARQTLEQGWSSTVLRQGKDGVEGYSLQV
jgi:hypothetical protein